MSRGRLCPKGQATFQLVTSSQRLTHVPVPRARGHELDAGWTSTTAIDLVVDRVLDTRDATWEDVDPHGRPLNRTTGMAVVGGATLDNEESYLLRKLATSLGHRDDGQPGANLPQPQPGRARADLGPGRRHRALWPTSPTPTACSSWARTWPRPTWSASSGCMEAKARGATVMHVDPRFTRTSAMADVYAQIRPGTDVAFLGALVNHVLSNELWFREFVLAYTNASTLVSPDYVDSEDLDGLFSGWDPERGEYDTTQLAVRHGPGRHGRPAGRPRHPAPAAGSSRTAARPPATTVRSPTRR